NCAAPPPCVHDRCTAGDRMGTSLCADACVQLVCRLDPYCCSAGWDGLCVAHTLSVCPGEPCPACGDATLSTPGEICDPTALPSGCPTGFSCTPDCGACEPVCGGGMRAGNEVCDPPGTQGTCPGGTLCNFDCSACTPRCGDGVRTIDPDHPASSEECDPPGQHGACVVDGDVCNAQCKCQGVCGDGKIGSRETCE